MWVSNFESSILRVTCWVSILPTLWKFHIPWASIVGGKYDTLRDFESFALWEWHIQSCIGVIGAHFVKGWGTRGGRGTLREGGGHFERRMGHFERHVTFVVFWTVTIVLDSRCCDCCVWFNPQSRECEWIKLKMNSNDKQQQQIKFQLQQQLQLQLQQQIQPQLQLQP